ncbi:hypothetical protein DY000_02043043 [Brassica cretica]|uniref:Uncharacterized protein n=1 Tax=Brassica cretica TaxID=69181 RepID=A0ABQ7B7G5_BRACR|nr:hypothetical protein DY000_02043043 [Brassica cretica]
MDPQFQHLPPLKKLRLMQRDLERAHQQQQLPSQYEKVKSLQLPAKKSKQSRDDDDATTYPLSSGKEENMGD